MAAGIAYPYLYDTIQLLKQQTEYFNDPWNITDFLFQYGGMTNIVFQFFFEPSSTSNTCSMSIVLVLALVKTMAWMRIFSSMALLVCMIKQTFKDLVPFLTFFFIMIIVFTFLFGVLAFTNYNGNPPEQNGNPNIEFLPNGDENEEFQGEDAPGCEYLAMHMLYGNFFAVFRTSLGDTDVASLFYVNVAQKNMFWAVWMVILFLFQIIFLNFIIGELSNTYQTVMDNYDRVALNVRAQLVGETEEMFPDRFYDATIYHPKYVIVRQIES